MQLKSAFFKLQVQADGRALFGVCDTLNSVFRTKKEKSTINLHFISY